MRPYEQISSTHSMTQRMRPIAAGRKCGRYLFTNYNGIREWGLEGGTVALSSDFHMAHKKKAFHDSPQEERC